MWQKNLEAFSRARRNTLGLLERLSQQQLDYRPSSGRWSIGEVMDHLYLVERFFRSQFQFLIDQQRSGQRPSLFLSFADLNVRPAFVPDFLLPLLELPLTMTNVFMPRALFRLLLATPLGRARHPDAANPRAKLAKEVLQAQLVDGLTETRALFEQNPDIDFKRLRIRHPLLGDNSVIELLDIMTAHEQGHLRRMHETVSQLSDGARASIPAEGQRG